MWRATSSAKLGIATERNGSPVSRPVAPTTRAWRFTRSPFPNGRSSRCDAVVKVDNPEARPPLMK